MRKILAWNPQSETQNLIEIYGEYYINTDTCIHIDDVQCRTVAVFPLTFVVIYDDVIEK